MEKKEEEKKEQQKDKSMFLFFLKMVFLFILITEILVDGILVNGALIGITSAKYGFDFLIEGLRALFILIVLILFGNSYIFKEKRTNFKDSILLGWPILVIATIYLLQGILNLRYAKFDINAVLNCVALCITVGIFEEFLCRGWLQNEFIERFKQDKNQIIKSIVLASLVFGIMHITNIWNTNQGIFGTLMQIIQALSVGILFGSIYYKTKNIWSVVFLHAFYDLALTLSEVPMIRDCQVGVYSKEMTIFHIVSSILISTLYIITSILVLRSNVGEKIVTINKKRTEQNRKLKIACIILLAITLAPVHIKGEEDAQVCFSYEEQKLDGFYYVVEVDPSEYYFEMKGKDSTIIIAEDEEEPGQVFLKDNNGNVVKLDYEMEEMLVVDNIDTYKVVIIEDGVAVSTAHYIEIQKDKITASYDYLKLMKKSFDTYELPYVVSVGYVENRTNSYRNIYIRGQYKNQFIIDENNDLYFVTKE